MSCDFQITLKNGNIGGGGTECNFSLTILNENCLLLQLPINSSHTIDARIEKHACMVPLSVVIMGSYVKFVSNHPFLWNCLKLLGWIAGKFMQHISNGFCHMTFNSHSKMNIDGRGGNIYD